MANENEININLAEKYSDAVDERFKLASITNSAINNNYDFDGVNTISIYSVDTAKLNDYNRKASSNRYGTPSELGNAIQKLTLSQDKGFTFTIDRGNYDDSVMASSAGNALQREIDEVITPTIDKYRLSKIFKGAGTVIEQEITTVNAYTMFLDATTILTENLVPVQNRIAFVTPNFYKCLKLDKNFTGSADRVNDLAVTGSITKIDNISIIVAPTSWHGQLENFKVETPSEEFNNMINVWNAYQCFITFVWSRAASFIYCGLRNGYGYRDTVQDIQGIIHLDPEMAADKIRFMLSAQVDNGGGLPLVKFNHNAGHENTPDDPEYVKETGHPSYRADDALWLFPTIVKYIGESGNIGFLDEVIVYANGGEATVYEHLKNAIRFSMERLGDHDMPAGLHADWNDCLRLGAKGESTFVAFQLYYAMTTIKEMAILRNDSDYIAYIDDVQGKLADALEKCWDEDRFIRGIREDGVIVGAKKDPEANMWLNPQSWSVISRFASDEQAEKAMNSVHEILNTPYGAKLLEPPYKDHYFDGALMHIFNDDTKENGGIFSQSQGWLILAEALLGHRNRAFEYFMESSPAAMNEKAEIRVMEPYVHGQFTESKASPFEGRSHVHWLTGTASTVMRNNWNCSV